MPKLDEGTIGCDVPQCDATAAAVAWVRVSGWRFVLERDVCPQHVVVVTLNVRLTVDGVVWAVWTEAPGKAQPI